LKQVDSITDVYFAPVFPVRIDNRLIARLQFTSFANGDVRDVRVLVVFNPVDQSLSKTGVALVERLTERRCRPDAGFRRGESAGLRG